MLTRSTTISALALAIVTLFSTALPAAAAQFNVKPIRVFLSKDAGSTVLTIENQAPNVLRLQIRPYAWSNDAHGQPLLVPTDDLVVFPTLVNVNPMEHRSIRIGFSGTAAPQELTYRIALDELPSLESQISAQKQSGLQVRTRITVPVFLTPPMSTEKVLLDDPVLRRGAVSADFRNVGNVHTTVSSAEIVGKDAGGTQIFDKKINGWYVLAGESWHIAAALSGECSRVKTISVTVQSDAGKFSRSIPAAGGCK